MLRAHLPLFVTISGSSTNEPTQAFPKLPASAMIRPAFGAGTSPDTGTTWGPAGSLLASDSFVRNCNSALGEQILDVTKVERETEIEPDRLVNDLRREPISGVTDFRHALRLPSRRRRDNAFCAHRAHITHRHRKM